MKFVERIFPILDIGLAMLAGAVWYVRPQIGVWPFGLIAIAWLLRWAVYGSPTRATLFDFPIALFLITAFVAASIAHNQGVEWSQHLTPLEWAWGKYYYILGAIGLYYAIANLRTVDHVWWFVRCYALFGALVAAYFLLTNDWSARAVKFPVLTEIGLAMAALRPEISGHRLHPNVAGGMMAMILPFFVPLIQEAWARKQRGRIALWSVASIAVLFGWVMSSSRGAWLALALVSLGWYLAHHVADLSRRSDNVDQARGRRVIGWVIPLLLIVASLMLLFIGTTDLLGNGWQIPGASTVFSRLELMTGSLSLARDYFFTGGGLGAFPMLFSTYYLLVPVYYIIYSHNLFLDILIEQGILGLLSYLWILGILFMFALNAFRNLTPSSAQEKETSARARLIFEGTVASIGVMILHGLVDDIPYGSRALLIMLVLPAIVAALAPHLPRLAWHFSSKLIPLAIAFIALGLLWQRELVLGAWYANLGAIAQARVELQQYAFSQRTPEVMRQTVFLAQAEQYYNEALRFDPENVTANQRLAMIALARGSPAEARTNLERAYRREPGNPVTQKLLEKAQ